MIKKINICIVNDQKEGALTLNEEGHDDFHTELDDMGEFMTWCATRPIRFTNFEGFDGYTILDVVIDDPETITAFRKTWLGRT